MILDVDSRQHLVLSFDLVIKNLERPSLSFMVLQRFRPLADEMIFDCSFRYIFLTLGTSGFEMIVIFTVKYAKVREELQKSSP